jgi:hypothetical protein
MHRFCGTSLVSIVSLQDDIEIDYVDYKSDSCIVNFTNQDGDTLRFNLCTKAMKKSKTAAAKTRISLKKRSLYCVDKR